MLKSMTGFARCACSGEWGNLSWEIRAVNHRFLDLGLRLPEELRGLEPEVRQIVSGRLARGKVDCVLRWQRPGAQTAAIHLNRPLLEALVAAGREVESLLHTARPASGLDALRWPGVVEEPVLDTGPVEKPVLELLGTTLEDLEAARGREGKRLGKALRQRLSGMTRGVAEVRARLPEVREQFRRRLEERLGQLEIETDSERLEQELVLLLQKMDVDEELDRLDSHIAEVTGALKRREPVGRRLDFLMQELNREANTLTSKSQDPDTTRAAVDMKVLVEQMREQVQNIE